MTSQSVALPDVKTWELRDPKTGETRTFEQTELSIEGEVRLVQLAGLTIKRLNEQGFPWEEVSRMFDDTQTLDWAKASEVLTLAIAEVPELAAESCSILFGLFPTDDNGIRNPQYDDDKKFIRKSVNFTRWIDILTLFTEQNDYKRLARPFSLAVTKAMETGWTISAQQQMRERDNESSSQELIDSLPQDTDTQDESSEL